MLCFVVNPASSSGRGAKVWTQVQGILQAQQVEYEAFLLQNPGDATRLARSIYYEYQPCTVVVVGGDGTISEFLTGLPSFSGITFACIPTGSGNDFAHGMRLPTNPADAVRMILSERRTRSINIGITTSGEHTRAFAVSSGFGYDAAVCYAVDHSRMKGVLNALHLGRLIYLFHAVRMLLSMQMFSVRLLTDDNQLLTFERVCFLAAMNTRYEGGGFLFAPKANPLDDQLDLVFAEGLPKWKILLILPTALFGAHLRFRGIHLIRCRHAVIQANADTCVHTDGEHFGFVRKVTFSLHREKLRLIVE